MITRCSRFLAHAVVVFVVLGISGVPSGSVVPVTGLDRTRAAIETAVSPRLTPEQAIAAAVNSLEVNGDGYQLRHPHHFATFTPDGLQFTPRRGGPTWGWQLSFVGAGECALPGVEVGALRPVNEEATIVSYARGGLVERYLTGGTAVEQQFVLPSPLALDGADLVIAGSVRSMGRFEEVEDGWRWRSDEGAVHLGRVQAYDAQGRSLPARMTATADGTRIEVDGAALAGAAYPVTLDPEIGSDFRISDMGAITAYDAYDPAAAYNSTNNEYLVVWSGDDNTGTLVDEEEEIFGQRIDAASGAELGTNDFRLSDMGPDGNTSYDARTPAVAWNSTDNQYLVVWSGDDDTGALLDEEYEIWGQRVDATGAEIGIDARLSDVGGLGNAAYDALDPAVAYNRTNNEYLVVWSADDPVGGVVNEEYEIYGQRLNAATGAGVGANDFRLSDMGGTGSASYDALTPAVAWNSTNNQYLVVWQGDDNTAPLVDNEDEIFGQRVNGPDGAQIGADFRLSDMGPNGNTGYAAYDPAVAYNGANNEYLVVWRGDDNTAPLVNNEFEIFGQRVNATGVEVGSNDFRLSDMGPDGSVNYGAYEPAVAWNSTNNQYLVVWSGDDNSALLVDNEREIFGQRVNGPDGAEVGADFRLSDMGPDGDINYGGYSPAVAWSSFGNQYLVLWDGDDNAGSLVDGDTEVFGQRVAGADGAEVGGDTRLSDLGSDTLFDAYDAAVAYNRTNNEYLVVWRGDDNSAPLVSGESEIFGQRIDAATGAELGTNDFRLSDMGPDGNTAYAAVSPAVAWDSTDNQYLVVWEGDDNTGGLLDEEYEIWGQRVNAVGAEIGSDTRLSDVGGIGNANYDANDPAVAYNHTNNEYLVVWSADDPFGGIADNEFEIFGQRVNAATGGGVGTNDFRLSDMGGTGNASFDAVTPAVAWNSIDNQYLVVWSGDDSTAPLVDNENEIFGQRVNGPDGAQIGGDFRLSDMGPDGDVNYDAFAPAVAWNSTNNQYLVVWCGDDNTAPLVDGEQEIFGQRVNGPVGAEIGVDFRLSDMGPDGNTNSGAYDPAVAWSSASNQYLVVWSGDEDAAPPIGSEFEIFGQRVNGPDGAELGTDFRLSDMGPDGDGSYDAFNPAVAYNSTNSQFLVTWCGDDSVAGLVNDEFEIFGQRFAALAGVFLPLVVRGS